MFDGCVSPPIMFEEVVFSLVALNAAAGSQRTHRKQPGKDPDFEGNSPLCFPCIVAALFVTNIVRVRVQRVIANEAPSRSEGSSGLSFLLNSDMLAGTVSHSSSTESQQQCQTRQIRLCVYLFFIQFGHKMSLVLKAVFGVWIGSIQNLGTDL